MEKERNMKEHVNNMRRSSKSRIRRRGRRGTRGTKGGGARKGRKSSRNDSRSRRSRRRRRTSRRTSRRKSRRQSSSRSPHACDDGGARGRRRAGDHATCRLRRLHPPRSRRRRRAPVPASVRRQRWMGPQRARAGRLRLARDCPVDSPRRADRWTDHPSDPPTPEPMACGAGDLGEADRGIEK